MTRLAVTRLAITHLAVTRRAMTRRGVKRRGGGFALIMVLGLVALLGGAFLIYTAEVYQTQATLELHRRKEAAEVQADSGLVYAKAMLARGHWLTARQFASPLLAPEQSFVVTVTPLTGGRWSIRSLGLAGNVKFERTATYP